MKSNRKMKITIAEYIRINKEINRAEELERNGGRWVARNRPHKNRKKYDRKLQKTELKSIRENL